MNERCSWARLTVLAIALATHPLHAQDSLPRLAVTEKSEPFEPFGLSFLSPIKDLKNLPGFTEMESGLWAVKRVPRPHPDFDTYMLIADDSIGLCKVSAMSSTIQTSRYGRELRRKFAELREILTTRYGPPSTEMDRLESGSIWKDPGDFMMGLLKKERHLVSIWQIGEGSTNLPSNLGGILLLAAAQSQDEGLIALSYEHASFKTCADRMAKKKNSIL